MSGEIVESMKRMDRARGSNFGQDRAKNLIDMIDELEIEILARLLLDIWRQVHRVVYICMHI